MTAAPSMPVRAAVSLEVDDGVVELVWVTSVAAARRVCEALRLAGIESFVADLATGTT